MDVTGFTCGPLFENTYLAIHSSGQAVLVDPGFSSDQEWAQCKDKLNAMGASLAGILLTHAHLDHVLGIPKVVADYPDIELYMSDRFPEMWQAIPEQPAMFGVDFPVEEMSLEPIRLSHGSTIAFDEWVFDIRYTPGHSPDHVVFVSHSEGVVFAGDVLFKSSVGRTDIPFGDGHLLKESIETQLYTLPDDYVVYPGHGESTSIGAEKTSNPFVRAH
jgi:hydroxyacylglutathione hydrolase